MPKISLFDIRDALDLARQGSYTGTVNKLTGKPIPSVDPKAFLIYLATRLVDEPFHADIILASWMLLVGFTEEKAISKRQEMFVLSSGYKTSKDIPEGEIDRNAIDDYELTLRIQRLYKHEQRLYDKLAEKTLEQIATKGEDGAYYHNRANIRFFEEEAEKSCYNKNRRCAIIPNPSFRNPHPSPSGNYDSRNYYFISREETLQKMHDIFFKENKTRLILHGMAGVGKSAIANEYVHRHLMDYNLIWKLDASNKTTLSNSCRDFLIAEDASFTGSKNPRKIRLAFQRFFKNKSHWLLIFDNVDYLDNNKKKETVQFNNFRAYMPSAGGHIIITSRCTRPYEDAEQIPVTLFDQETSIKYLVNVTGKEADEHTHVVVECMGNLPLALKYSANYIKVNNISYSEYAELWHENDLKLLDVNNPAYSEQNVRHAFDITLNKLTVDLSSDESAAFNSLLQLCGALNVDFLPIEAYIKYLHDNIPRIPQAIAKELKAGKTMEFYYTDDDKVTRHYRFVLENGTILMECLSDPSIGKKVYDYEGPLYRILSNKLSRNELINHFTSYSIAEYRDGYLTMHPLLRKIIYDRMSPAQKRNYSSFTVNAILSEVYNIHGDTQLADKHHEISLNTDDSGPFASSFSGHDGISFSGPDDPAFKPNLN